jgi:cbb3-type cytochrome oxidase maturation protein
MNIIYVMIAVSLTISISFLVGFLWTIKSGQNDDLSTPSLRILIEENNISPNENK